MLMLLDARKRGEPHSDRAAGQGLQAKDRRLAIRRLFGKPQCLRRPARKVVLRPKARCNCFDSRASLPALEKAKVAAASTKQVPIAIKRPVKAPSHQAVTGTAMLARRRRMRMDEKVSEHASRGCELLLGTGWDDPPHSAAPGKPARLPSKTASSSAVSACMRMDAGPGAGSRPAVKPWASKRLSSAASALTMWTGTSHEAPAPLTLAS